MTSFIRNRTGTVPYGYEYICNTIIFFNAPYIVIGRHISIKTNKEQPDIFLSTTTKAVLFTSLTVFYILLLTYFDEHLNRLHQQMIS